MSLQGHHGAWWWLNRERRDKQSHSRLSNRLSPLGVTVTEHLSLASLWRPETRSLTTLKAGKSRIMAHGLGTSKTVAWMLSCWCWLLCPYLTEEWRRGNLLPQASFCLFACFGFGFGLVFGFWFGCCFGSVGSELCSNHHKSFQWLIHVGDFIAQAPPTGHRLLPLWHREYVLEVQEQNHLNHGNNSPNFPFIWVYSKCS